MKKFLYLSIIITCIILIIVIDTICISTMGDCIVSDVLTSTPVVATAEAPVTVLPTSTPCVIISSPAPGKLEFRKQSSEYEICLKKKSFYLKVWMDNESTLPANSYSVYPGQFTEYEIHLVAALIHREGPGSTAVGYKALASIVLNRVMNESRWFPDNIAGVIFQGQKKGFPHSGQFAGHTRHILEKTKPNKLAIAAANYVFRTYGSTLPKQVLFYRADVWHGKQYDHTFMKDTAFYKVIEGNQYYFGINIY